MQRWTNITPTFDLWDILSMLCIWARRFTLTCFTSLRCKCVPVGTAMTMCTISSMCRNGCRTVCSPWSWNDTRMSRLSYPSIEHAQTQYRLWFQHVSLIDHKKSIFVSQKYWISCTQIYYENKCIFSNYQVTDLTALQDMLCGGVISGTLQKLVCQPDLSSNQQEIAAYLDWSNIIDMVTYYNPCCFHPSRHKTLNQCWFNVSTTS